MTGGTHAEAPNATSRSSAHHLWFARVGSSLWLVLLVGVMVVKGRFEPLLLLALAVPFVALYVLFEWLIARDRVRPLAASVLVTGIGLLLVWLDRLITWRPDWADLVAPDPRWRADSLRFAATGGWIAAIGAIAVIVIAVRMRRER